MANQVAARLAGDDYQHLYAWYIALQLLDPHEPIEEVRIEDEDAGSFDDVTVRYAQTSRHKDVFYQVKYHVDHRRAYSTDVLLERKDGSSSLLQKFYRSWSKVTAGAVDRGAEFTLFSNWTWDQSDPVTGCIAGHDGTITSDFFDASDSTVIGQQRKRWQQELGSDNTSFRAFIGSLRFCLGSTDAITLARQVAERMELRKLHHDDTALKIAAGIVRDWIKHGPKSLTRTELEAAIAQHRLYAATDERAASVYVETIRKRCFDLEPDYLLDWREYFAGSAYHKGHKIVDSQLWNQTLLPELYDLEQRVNKDTRARLIRARGLSRLSVWFAVGYVFSGVAGYEIEVAQGAEFWRSDASPASDFILVPLPMTLAPPDADLLAVGISVTGSLEADVQRYLRDQSINAHCLFIQPKDGPSKTVLQRRLSGS